MIFGAFIRGMVLAANLAAAVAATGAEPHAAAELWDTSFASRKACEAALTRAISEAEPQQLRLLHHAECCAAGDAQKHYRVRPRWTRRPVRTAPR